MSLSQATRLARRETRGGLRGFSIFVACLTLGIATIAAIGSLRAAIEAGLAAEGATLLGETQRSVSPIAWPVMTNAIGSPANRGRYQKSLIFDQWRLCLAVRALNEP